MKTDTLMLLALAAGAYYLYTRSSSYGPVQPGFQVCRYPDGTTIQVPIGNSCPNDPVHGGQSMPGGSGGYCYPSDFVGPLPAGGQYC